MFEWMVPSMHAKLQSAAGLWKREGEGSSGQDMLFTAYGVRPPERTRLACRAVLPLTAASIKAKTPGPELSITVFHDGTHQVRQERVHGWVPLCHTLHHSPCPGSHPGCTVCLQAPCLSSEKKGDRPLVLVSIFPAGFPSAKLCLCCSLLSF